jgi:penicillin-binding protein-related factor A (putative recombinase)
MKEADFAIEVKHSLEKGLRNCHYKKIPDQLYNPSSFARFNPEKDYDAYVVYRGCFSALEYKLHKSKTAYPLNGVTTIQRSALLDVVENGGNAYVVIGVRFAQIRKAFFIPIKEFLIYCNNTDRKSMPMDIMDMYPCAQWRGKGTWELDAKWFLY